jgi:hypothetical protein
VDWISVARYRAMWRNLVNAVMNLRVLENAGKLSSGCMTDELSSNAQLFRVNLLVWLVSQVSNPVQPVGLNCLRFLWDRKLLCIIQVSIRFKLLQISRKLLSITSTSIRFLSLE